MTARDMTGFYAFSPPGSRAIFSTFGGDFLTKLHTQPGQKGNKSTGENSKNPVETAPRNCRFLSLVVVERALILAPNYFQKGLVL